jgi:hypothetical protein
MPCLGCREDDAECCSCVPRFLRRQSRDPSRVEETLQRYATSYTDQQRDSSSHPLPTYHARSIFPPHVSAADQAPRVRAPQGLSLEARALALLAQYPPSHYNTARVREMLAPNIFVAALEDRRDFLFGIETSFMIAPKLRTHQTPDMTSFVALLANGYNAQDPPPHRLASPIYRPTSFHSYMSEWEFSRPTPEVLRQPRVDNPGTYFSAAIQNMIYKLLLIKFYRESNIVLSNFSHIWSMAERL